MPNKRRAGPRNIILLTCYAADEHVVDSIKLSYHEYYDGSPEVIDSEEYRASRGITRLTGEIYDSTSKLQQSFENRYNERGEYVGGRAVHADGTIIDH
jgi:hypothetical protein